MIIQAFAKFYRDENVTRVFIIERENRDSPFSFIDIAEANGHDTASCVAAMPWGTDEVEVLDGRMNPLPESDFLSLAELLEIAISEEA